jgi:hypothetical protein
MWNNKVFRFWEETALQLLLMLIKISNITVELLDRRRRWLNFCLSMSRPDTNAVSSASVTSEFWDSLRQRGFSYEKTSQSQDQVENQ